MTTTAHDDRAGILYDFAVGRPDGFIYEDVQGEFGWDYSTFMKAVRALRRTLGGDEINLTCEPQGMNERWLYRLVGNPDDDGARLWQTNRIRDTEARLETIESVSTSIATGTDGRTVVGRKARMIASTVRHLRETLSVIGEER